MEITSLFANGAVSVRQTDKSDFIPEQNKSEIKFDSYMTKAETQKEEPAQTQKAEPVNKPQQQNVTPKEQTKAKPQQENTNNEQAPPQTVQTEQTAEQPAGTQPPAAPPAAENAAPLAETPVETPILNVIPDDVLNVLITEIADKLGMSKEDIADILNRLNLTPFDLTDKQNLVSFVRELYGAANNAELVNLPFVKDTIAAVENVLQNTVTDVTVTPQETALAAKPAEVTFTAPIVNETAAQTAPAATPEQTELTLQQEAPQTAAKTTQSGTQSGTQQQDNPAPQNAYAQTNEVFNEQKQAATDKIIESEQAANAADITSKATAKTEAAVKTAKAASPQEVIKQITEHIKTDVKMGASEIKITLRPESLGELSLKISMERGILTAQFTAESQRVKAIIEANMSELKNALNESGVNVGSLSVSVSQGENESMQAFERERQKSAKRIAKLIGDANDESETTVITEAEATEAQVEFTA